MRQPSIRYEGSNFPRAKKSELEYFTANRWPICNRCGCRPCSWLCQNVLTGTSQCPPRTPLDQEPLLVQEEVARRRMELGLTRVERSETATED
mgnify:FL=1